jgi:YegS/Rv2252/BmrU family lipid kinase
MTLNPAATPCLIFNPSAQGGRAARFRSHPDLPQGQCVFLATSAPGDARRLASQAVRDGFRTVIAAGGDGTANEVVNGIADVPDGLRTVRLGILPLGTVNVFARELRIPLRASRAWKVLRQARERAIDLGRAEFSLAGRTARRCFLQLAGAGLDSRAIELTSWNVKKRIGPFAYLLAAFKALSEIRPLVTVQAGSTLSGEWVAVGNGRFYGGPIPFFPGARLDDGRLDICVLPKISLLRVGGALAGLLAGRMHQFCRARLLSAPALTLASPARVLLQLDGENIGELPAALSIEPQALRVIVP